jgi:hypothetical protein
VCVLPNCVVWAWRRPCGRTQAAIDGSDPRIGGPVQTADPANQGGDRIDLAFGANLAGRGIVDGHRLAFEAVRPLYQDLNGPHLETDLILTLGWQYTF